MFVSGQLKKTTRYEKYIINNFNFFNSLFNGIWTDEKRFENADLNTIEAFKENVSAFKSKLRQIGFYNDLSDAFILQKIRPRYEI